jgi:hypothetical protein
LAQVFLEFAQLLVTKEEFHCEIRDLEKRILLKTGGMIAGAVVLQTALTALMFQFWLPH